MVQTLGNTVDQTITLSLVAKIAELKRMPDLAHELRTWRPQPDPMEEQLKQLAIQKAQLENEELKSKIALNNAKAKEAASSGDLKDLDYLEQESGTKHARDMEKQKAQSQGNQNLQITKALTTPTKEGETTPNISAAVGYNALTNGNSLQERDLAAQQDPTYSLSSQHYDPSQDPASALGMNL